MSGGIALSDRLRKDFDETMALYRQTRGQDIGVGELLENALRCYRDQLMDAARRVGGKEDTEAAHD